jgi:3-deoxy-manno-octulosonate cytidylyltransferase (CMP-KDO synthetase)
MRAVVLIPARLAATRLPNKPLAMIHGKPMIQHVYERALLARTMQGVFVATPDQAIAEAVAKFGGNVILTSISHPTGTDRLAEAITRLPEPFDVVVNVQGDEPLIDPRLIDRIAEPLLADPTLSMASACCPLPIERIHDPNAVKVVLAQNNNALYFSRAPIPFNRDSTQLCAPKLHFGLYAYRSDFLALFPTLARTPLEKAESLEQLRALEHGYQIRMIETDHAPIPVDTIEDLERVRKLLAA